MGEWIWHVVGPVIGTIVGSFSGWFFGRRKQRIEEIDAANSTYNKIIASLRENIETLLKQNYESLAKVKDLTNQVLDYQRQIEGLIDKNKKQISEIQILTIEVNGLRSKAEALKKISQENEKLKKTIVRYENLLNANNISY